MKRIVLSFIALVASLNVFAGTPAEGLVEKYKDIKGARNLVAKGAVMNMARPMLKKHNVAPIAHKVEEMSVLRMDKASPEVRLAFLEDMKETFRQYVYAGKSDTPNGVVDAYVHLLSPDVADELVVFNPKLCAIYSLSGEFTKEELLNIQKKP